MRRWLRVWLLTRQRDSLSHTVDWIRDVVWSGQVQLEKAENRLRAVQAELWAAEVPEKLIDRSQADAGMSQRG